jgi:hypothetical protein
VLGNVVGQRVVRVWRAQQRLDAAAGWYAQHGTATCEALWPWRHSAASSPQHTCRCQVPATANPPYTHAPKQHGADLQRGAPLVLEDVQANATQLVNVGVVYLCQEPHLRMRMCGCRQCVCGRRSWCVSSMQACALQSSCMPRACSEAQKGTQAHHATTHQPTAVLRAPRTFGGAIG